MRALKLQHPTPEEKIDGLGVGERPGVYSCIWFDEPRFLLCVRYHSGPGDSAVDGFGLCAECGETWKIGEPRMILERCGTCVRVALRKGEELPALAPLGLYEVCAFCGETICGKHVLWTSDSEDGEPICRACSRKRREEAQT